VSTQDRTINPDLERFMAKRCAELIRFCAGARRQQTALTHCAKEQRGLRRH
jgi:hypothetical protein